MTDEEDSSMLEVETVEEIASSDESSLWLEGGLSGSEDTSGLTEDSTLAVEAPPQERSPNRRKGKIQGDFGFIKYNYPHSGRELTRDNRALKMPNDEEKRLHGRFLLTRGRDRPYNS